MSTRQTVTLTDPQSDFLKREAGEKDISVSDLIRRIIDEYREPREAAAANDKPLFSTPWTGGPRAVAVAVYRDHAIVGHWNKQKQTRIDLTTEQAVELARLATEEFDPMCQQAEAVAVAERLDEMSGGRVGDFTSMLPGR